MTLGSLPWAVPSWHCHLKYSNLCVHHPETAKLLRAPLLRDLWAWSLSNSHPTSTQTRQPEPLMPRWLPSASQRKALHSPDSFDSVPPAVAERAVHRDGNNATAQIVATIKKKLKCYCLPWKDQLPAKLLRLPYSLLAQIWGRVESFGVPAVMLFCKVSLMDKQAKLPESVWVPSSPSHGSKKRASAWPSFPKTGDLWRSVIYRPLA